MSSGEVRWQYDTAHDGQAAEFHGDPWISDSLLVVGCDVREGATGHLYAFEPRTGRLRWKQPLGRGVSTDVLGAAGRLHVVTMQDEAQAFDAGSGGILWRFAPVQDAPQRTSLVTTPVLVSGCLFFVSRSGVVHALDAATGRLLWESPLGARANTSLAHLAGKLYAGTIDGRVLRLDARSGNLEAEFATGGLPYGRLVVAGDALLALWFQGKPEEYGENEAPHTLACLDPSLEKTRWTHESPVEWTSYKPLVRGSQVLAGNEAGLLQALDLGSGELRWSTEFRGAVRGLGSSDTRLFVGTIRGSVYAMPLTDGAATSTRPDAAAIATLPASRGGQVLLGKPFPALPVRWLGAEPPAPSDRHVTLYRWWTDTCPFCAVSLPALEKLRRQYESRSLRVVGVYHPKPPRPVADAEILNAAGRLGFHGRIAVDTDWSALAAACRGSESFEATSVSFLVDANGIVRFVHPGHALFPSDDPRHATEASDFALLENAIRALLDLASPREQPR